MKIAFTHNLRLTDSEEEAEFDSAETVDAIAGALTAAGHDVAKVEVSGPASHLAARLEAWTPDLIFNTAEGRRGRAREAFYPALFEELGFPYTGSDAYVLAVTLDKHMTKLVLAQHGVDAPRGRLVTAADFVRLGESACAGVPLPCIVKPNYEGSSKGIGDDSVARDVRQLYRVVQRMLEAYPAGVLMEEYIAGTDITVPMIEGTGDEGVLTPVEYLIAPEARSKYNLYDYRLKNQLYDKVNVRCPAELPRDVLGRVRAIAKTVFRALAMRDLGRIDFRLGEDGRIYFLEVNALPSLEKGAGLFAAAGREGLSYQGALQAVVRSAARRWNLPLPATPEARPVKPLKGGLRIGFAFNIKRVSAKSGDDSEAEYDPPETIDSIRRAIESFGHTVVPLEANPEFPRLLAESRVEFVFNIAEGVVGRNREAVVPALCELLGIPYTGSDSATLAIALDKALTKKVLRQHNVLTPEFQVMQTGKERLAQALRFPLIVKPNQEGTSKGISGSSVVDDETALRAAVREILERYRQPALIEEYIPGREFTVGLLGDRRPRVLPPMEILFKDAANPRPVYDYLIKQDWQKYVEYACPARLSPQEARAIERAARETFLALDCRDVARVDLRMNPQGAVYVLEVNPLPGLTPDYSDLVLIAKAAGLDYRTLIGEILAGGLKRLREKRREDERAERARKLAQSPAGGTPPEAEALGRSGEKTPLAESS
jgi:D-alanine-D-alanine ligase